MSIKALPLLTGGLNEKTRSDLIEENQLQVCTNYEINGDGFLHRRKAVSEYDPGLTTAIDAVFITVTFVSEPYYPQTKIKISDVEMDSDFILFVFGYTFINTYELHAFFYNLDNEDKIWTNVVNSDDKTLSDLLTDGDINYDSDSDIQISVAHDSVFIADGVNHTHMVSVDTDGVVRAGISGIPAPTNKARVTEMTDWQPELWEETENASYLSEPGLFQCVYTVVTKTGEESNPSPLSDTLDMQFFKLDADSVDERWIEKIEIRDLTVPDVPDNILEQLESFKVYMRVMRYSEGGDAKTLEFTEAFKINSKRDDNGDPLHYGTNTGNDYVLTIASAPGDTASYENDIAPVAKTVDSLGGITMVGNVKTKKAFPHEFKYNIPITLNNTDSKGYVDAVIKIRLEESNIDNFSVGDFVLSTRVLESDMSQHIRLYDEDLTTPIMVAYNGYNNEGDVDTNSYIDLYIKIPYLKSASLHTIYLVWTPADAIGSYDGVPSHYNDLITDTGHTWDGNLGVHYGRFMIVGNHSWSMQQVWNNTRVSDGDLIVDDFEGRFSTISNKADTSSDGTSSDIEIIANPFHIPIIQETIGGNAIKLSSANGYVDYDYDDTVSFTEKGTIFVRMSISGTSLAENGWQSIITLIQDDDKFLSFGFNASTFYGNLRMFLYGQEYDDTETHFLFYDRFKNVDDNSYIDLNINFEGYVAVSWEKTSSSGENRWVASLYYKGTSTNDEYRLATINYKSPPGVGSNPLPYTTEEDYLLYYSLDNISTINNIKIGYMGNLEGWINPTGIENSKYDDFRFVPNFFLDPEDDSHNDMFINLANYMPGFDNIIGYKYSDTSNNNNISFDETKEIETKERKNMVKWTDVGYTSFPDLFFKQVKEPVKRIMAAPSFLQFEYQNTFIIFTRNSINRFVLKGSADGWSGSSSSLIEEKTQYGLLADKSLVRAGDALFWLSEVGVVLWNKDGMNLISKNIVDVPIDSSAIGFYSPLNNQYILHFNEDAEDGEDSETIAGVWNLSIDISAGMTETAQYPESGIYVFGNENVTEIFITSGNNLDSIHLAEIDKNVYEVLDDNSFNVNITLLNDSTLSDILTPGNYIKFIRTNTGAYYWSVESSLVEAGNDTVVNNGVSYVYHIERNVWTKFTGLSVSSAGTLTGGKRKDNINLLLDTAGTVNKYPTDVYTPDLAEIRTKELFFEKGVLRRMKADFVKGQNDVDMVSIMKKNDLSGNEIIKINTITNPNSNHWRGINLANSRGKEMSFKITNANMIKSIMYDLKIED